ncbi:MAG: redoxin domain-containing protein [Bacteroidales bacterium]|nr:redoxin domain-containing protein [Bacteroidales bacterium]
MVLNLKKSYISYLFIFVLLFSVSEMVAQETAFDGTLSGAEGYEIRLSTTDDYISNRTVILYETWVDSAGYFLLTADHKEIRKVFIETGFYKLEMFALPGDHYQFFCDTVSLKNEYRPLYNLGYLPCSLISGDTSGLNEKINHFDRLYNEFVYETFSGYYQRRDLRVIYAFEKKTDSIFGSPEDDFFGIYRKYKLASLKLSIAPTRKAKLFQEYLNDQEIRYNHPEFMNFFTSLFDRHLTGNNRFIQRYELKEMINQPVAYDALIDSLGKDTLLRNEKIRELVLMMTFKELYYQPDLYAPNILNYLNYISEQSKFALHRRIAENLIFVLTRLQNGFPAPGFTLPDLYGDTVRLHDFLGKPVYIGFMNTLSFASLGEFEYMDSLFVKYQNQIHFITISFDFNREVISKFKDEKNYNWTFLYNGNRYGITEKYDLKTLPLFVLIDGNGNILQFPARKPSENVSASLERLIDQ